MKTPDAEKAPLIALDSLIVIRGNRGTMTMMDGSSRKPLFFQK
jgi:hypothetical protein